MISSHPVDAIEAMEVKALASEVSKYLKDLACSSLNLGKDCGAPGIKDAYEIFMSPEENYGTMNADPVSAMLDSDLLPHVTSYLDAVTKALATMRDDMELYIAERLRVASLTEVNYTALPEYDASHPHWLTDATSTSIQGTEFYVPVVLASNLQYPKNLNRDDRQVKLAANASIGLDTNFIANLENNTTPGQISMRWQRFTSKTGFTRSFPATFDNSTRDRRFDAWYRVSTQTPKNVLIIIDLSESMRMSNTSEIAKQVAYTVLQSLIPQDSVNVYFMAGSNPGLPPCFQSSFYPATAENIEQLVDQIASSVVTGGEDVDRSLLFAYEMINSHNNLLCQAASQRLCNNRDSYIFLISDGVFNQYTLPLQDLNAQLPPQTYLMGVEVGPGADESKIHEFTCSLRGKYFKIESMYLLSEIRSMLDDWFQMIAAPLVKGNMTDLISLSLPTLSSTADEILFTISLPCFTDTSSTLPRLVGAVSIDLAFISQVNTYTRALFPFLASLRPKSAQGVAAFDKGGEWTMIYNRGYPGTVLLNAQKVATFEAMVKGKSKLSDPTNVLMFGYEDEVFANSGILNQFVTQYSGMQATSSQRCFELSKMWDLSPLRCLDQPTWTFAWKRLENLPITVVLKLPGTFESSNVSLDRKMPFVGWNKFSTDLLPSATCQRFEKNPELLHELMAVNFVPEGSSSSIACSIANVKFAQPPTYRKNIEMQSLAADPAVQSWIVLPLTAYSEPWSIVQGTSELDSWTGPGGLRLEWLQDIDFTGVVDLLWRKRNLSSSWNDAKQDTVRFAITSRGLMRYQARDSIAAIEENLSLLELQFFYQSAVVAKERISITPPSLPFFTSQSRQGKSYSVLSVSVPFVEHNSSSLNWSSALVVGAELPTGQLKTMLTMKALQGKCLERDSYRCFLLNSAGVVVVDSLQAAAEVQDMSSWPQGLRFISDLEPALAEGLVRSGFLRLRDEPRYDAEGNRSSAYEANSEVLPLGPLLLVGKTRGEFHVQVVEGTDLFLVFADLVQSADPVPATSCGTLSDVCPSVLYPQIYAPLPVLCPLDVSFQNRSYLLLPPDAVDPDFQLGILSFLQIADFCPETIPSWHPYTIAGALLLLLLALYVIMASQPQSLLEENRKIASAKEKANSRFSFVSSYPLDKASQRSGIDRIKGEVQAVREEVSGLMQQASDIDDLQHVIQRQDQVIQQITR
eukprot:768369-Hanusia_phi.AAC.2